MKFLGVIPSLSKYKNTITLDVKGSDGVIRPITKVYYSKPCLACGMDMDLDYYKKGHRIVIDGNILSKRKIVRWKCTGCDYCEREESDREEQIRQGEL